MNLRGGLALMRSTWSSWMQHRGFFFLLAFGWMMPMLVYLLVWTAAAGDQSIGGIARGELVFYYLILILVNQLTYSQTNWTVGDMIRYGNLSFLLLRPMPPLFDTLASEVAGKVVTMVFVVPVVIILGLILRPDLHITTQAGIAFIPALVLAWMLRFFWGYWLALLAFWATRADSLLSIQDALIFLIGGQVAPLSLLPENLQLIAKILPFRYMVGFPAEVLSGQVAGGELWMGLIIQVGWLSVSMLLSLGMWRSGLKRFTAVGG
ncbi:MAG: ABC-2 family transporter protein [Anaerolineaceae bacterium]|nr:ABC-2 family transporter protein [Anaerolineaceae bacterium]